MTDRCTPTFSPGSTVYVVADTDESLSPAWTGVGPDGTPFLTCDEADVPAGCQRLVFVPHAVLVEVAAGTLDTGIVRDPTFESAQANTVTFTTSVEVRCHPHSTPAAAALVDELVAAERRRLEAVTEAITRASRRWNGLVSNRIAPPTAPTPTENP